MKMLSAAGQGALASLICSAVLLAGCSITVMPNRVPPVKGYEELSLTEASLIITNAEKDSAEYAIQNEKGTKTGLLANRQRWSKRLVEALASELAKRGAQVRINAPLTLNIALPRITFSQFKNLYQFKATVTATLSTGWSRNYEGIAETGLNAFESVTAMADRLAGQALTNAVKAMLRDEDFLAHLKEKS